MTPDLSRLRQLLSELRVHLDESESVDAATRVSLKATIADIEQKLSGTPLTASSAHSFGHRLSEAALEFEASHPQLAGTLGSIIDALGGMGI